ncbi:Aste57867_22805 [Aphanomyces stellatus]|uniref:Aste57867_22805 protein n=1 Tax=Aphanomyces stellatus TaxID=120398 RepID=A0A485LKY8_9STRA|nr:hypothetical protein As57867_022735 [Aphanomyces stellatus]VFT99456.1 Aste57867_22805 [Aphanomyces stellatus]
MHRLLVPGLLSVATTTTHARVEWVSSRTSRMALAAEDKDPDFSSSVIRPIGDDCQWNPLGTTGVDITTEAAPGRKDTCFGQDIFGSAGKLAYPFPRSSYNYDLDDPLALLQDPPNPNIKLDVGGAKSPPGFAGLTTTASFTYNDFEATGDAKIFGTLPVDIATKPGKYSLRLTAYDYHNVASKVCSACLAVSDTTRPTFSDKTQCKEFKKDAFTKDNIDSLNGDVVKFHDLPDSIKSNGCSDDRCDHLSYRFQGIKDGPQSTDSSSVDEWKTCLSKTLQPCEIERLTTAVFDVATTCSRSCDYNLNLKEYFTAYTCANSYTVSRTCIGADNNLGDCTMTQTITINPNDLVKDVKVQFHTPPASTPQPIANPSTLFGVAAYKAPSIESKELHFDAHCDKNKVDKGTFDKFCDFKLKVSDLFSTTASRSTDSAAQTLLGPLTADQIVFWRVRQTLNGEWSKLTDNPTFFFDALQTTLWFEAYTACGQVATEAWDIYVHRTEIVPSDCWFDSLWQIDSNKCNAQGTDFGVVHFHFDPTADEFKTNVLNPTPTLLMTPAELLGADDDDEGAIPATVTSTDPDCDPTSLIWYAKCGPWPAATAATVAADPNPSLLLADDDDNKVPVAVAYGPAKTCAGTAKPSTLLVGCVNQVDLCIWRQVAGIENNGLRYCYEKFSKSNGWLKFTKKDNTVQKTNYDLKGCQGTAGTTSLVTCTEATDGSFNVVLQAPPRETRIHWDFNGFQCTWQYGGASVTTPKWLDTLNAVTQTDLKKDIAVKLLNKDVTKATVSCDLFFINQNTKEPYKQTRAKNVFFQNCDTPRWNVAHPTDKGKFIAGTCANSWNPAAEIRTPAPFEACYGPMIFPTSKAATGTTYLAGQSELKCCNAPSSTAFQCRFLDATKMTGFCSDDARLPLVKSATIYSERGYAGKSQDFYSSVDKYSLASFGNVKSVKVSSGYTFIGDSSNNANWQIFPLDHPFLGSIFDPTAPYQTITIRPSTAADLRTDLAKIYEHYNYGGDMTSVGLGYTDLKNPNVRGKVSAFILADGYILYGYDASGKNLGTFGNTNAITGPLNDVIVAVEVRPKSTTPFVMSAVASFASSMDLSHSVANIGSMVGGASIALVAVVAVVVAIVHHRRRKQDLANCDADDMYIALIN